jgi:hypothetical protein
MVRRYDDPIEVRTRLDERRAEGFDEPDVPGAVPTTPVAFVWRDRLYVVRGVLAHWYERRAWWREAAASALLGLRAEVAFGAGAGVAADGQGVAPQGVATATTGPVLGTVLPDGGRSVVEPAEREVWRVEAAAGRTSPVGVYDLVRDPDRELVGAYAGSGGAALADGWRLVRLDD